MKKRPGMTKQEKKSWAHHIRQKKKEKRAAHKREKEAKRRKNFTRSQRRNWVTYEVTPEERAQVEAQVRTAEVFDSFDLLPTDIPVGTVVGCRCISLPRAVARTLMGAVPEEPKRFYRRIEFGWQFLSFMSVPQFRWGASR